MQDIFTPDQGMLTLAFYGMIMVGLALWSRAGHRQDRVEFLLAGRNVGVVFGGMSIAVSWIWAPALFVATQKAYESGISGMLTMIVPNMLTLVLFSFIALKARKIFPDGFTLPQLIRQKYDRKTHILYVIQHMGLQICSFSIQLFAGSALISTLTGLSFHLVGVILIVIALSYSLIGGLRASIMTDLLQMTLIFLVVGALVPMTIESGGGVEKLIGGLSGAYNPEAGWFDPWVLYSFGIPAAIALICGPVADQMQWQRAFALRSDHNVVKTFTLGAALFTCVPLSLSLLGFLAANPDVSAGWEIPSSQMIGPIAVANLLPDFMLLAFAIMLLSGLCSTLDSCLCAISSLTAIDVFKDHEGEKAGKGRKVFLARLGMLGVGVIGLAMISIPGMSLVYLWLFTVSFRAPSFVPTILTLFWRPMNSNVVFAAILSAFVIGGSVYLSGAILQNPHLVVAGSILPIIISGAICVIFTRHDKFGNERHLDDHAPVKSDHRGGLFLGGRA